MSDIEQQMRALAASYGGAGHFNGDLAGVFQKAADEIANLRDERDRLDNELKATLKSCLFHFGPTETGKVVADALKARQQ